MTSTNILLDIDLLDETDLLDITGALPRGKQDSSLCI